MKASRDYDDDTEMSVTSEIGPWGMVPAWVLKVKDKAGKGLLGADIRVYVALRTFADRSGRARPFVETIADRADVNVRTAEKSIARMRGMGLLLTRRRYRDDGSIARCDYRLRDTPPDRASDGASARDDDRQDVGKCGLAPADAPPPGPQAGTPPVCGPVPSRPTDRSKNTPDEHTKRTHQGTELNWPTADAAGAHKIDPSLIPTVSGPRDDAQPAFTDWSPDDFELFVSVLGGMNMCSDGSVWRPEGEHPLGTWYWAFRRRAGNPMRWPGRYFERIRDNEGVDGYLLSQGLVVTV